MFLFTVKGNYDHFFLIVGSMVNEMEEQTTHKKKLDTDIQSNEHIHAQKILITIVFVTDYGKSKSTVFQPVPWTTLSPLYIGIIKRLS